jgi:hypothetical protein
MVNHAWAKLRGPAAAGMPQAIAGGLTFVAVVIGWVFFRAPDVPTAWRMLGGMAGLNGAVMPAALLDRVGAFGAALRHLGITAGSVQGGFAFSSMWAWVLGLLALAWFAPNTQQIMARAEPTLQAVAGTAPSLLRWAPAPRWGLAIGAVAAIGLLSVTHGREFLYWQF